MNMLGFKKMPGWLIGGSMAILYFLIFGILEYVHYAKNGFELDEGIGLGLCFYNLPSCMMINVLPYHLRTNSIAQIVAMVISNFMIGAFFGFLFTWERKRFNRKKTQQMGCRQASASNYSRSTLEWLIIPPLILLAILIVVFSYVQLCNRVLGC